MNIEHIVCEGCGNSRAWRGFECLSSCPCLKTTNETEALESEWPVGKRVWYTGGGVLLTGIIEIYDTPEIYCWVRLDTGELRPLSLFSLHKYLEGAIWECEAAAEYWQRKAIELVEERDSKE